MTQSGRKVIVIGGAGQAGKIHTKNLLSIGCDTACYDVVKNDSATKCYDAKSTDYQTCIDDGYDVCVIALPDTMLHPHGKKLLSCKNLKAVLIEKPGSMKSSELQELVDLAKSNNVPFFIDYQRSFDPRVANLTNKLNKLKSEGYSLDFVSVYSCDKAQPPQPAHQALNQGCHDYAMLLQVLKAFETDVKNMTSYGVKWGELNDTKFLKATGATLNGGIFDVQMCRVDSSGTFTEMYIKVSKFDAQSKMYLPVEERITWPEKKDPNALWSDTWKDSFTESVKNLIDFENKMDVLVTAQFGVEVLKFAEKVLKTLQ